MKKILSALAVAASLLTTSVFAQPVHHRAVPTHSQVHKHQVQKHHAKKYHHAQRHARHHKPMHRHVHRPMHHSTR